MKRVILLQLLTSLAAGTPVVQRQDTGVDATALGQSWIQKVEKFVNADQRVDSEIKKALINNMSKCSLGGSEPLVLGASTSYRPECPTIFDGDGSGGATDATALGQAWIAAAEKAVGKSERPQTKQRILSSILNCEIMRASGYLIGDADNFQTFCPSQLGDKGNPATEAEPVAPLPSPKEEPNSTEQGGQRKTISASRPFLEPASLSESDEICGPLSGASGVDEKGTSEACVGTEIFCRQRYYIGTSEEFANADECLDSRVDPDAIIFPEN
ncbi:hypothetical protein IF1G_11411 [Cordyceps javanica]|uniref:Uncharacterized protein n=1 Tax=Cordyceps javanica TaxID=43265 RepID=A0A545VIC2_9HYPO|nr:hypothetical protein IF1G_11411 [Cordyceps javanica]TQW01396.1 hypothetical protein IF2G_11084 [Cordyceps javanica]